MSDFFIDNSFIGVLVINNVSDFYISLPSLDDKTGTDGASIGCATITDLDDRRCGS